MHATAPRHGEPDRPIALADLARDPGRIDVLAREEIAAVVLEIAALEARIAARVLQLGQERQGDGDERLLGIDEAAERLGVGRDWLRRRTATLPFAVKLGPGAIRYSAGGLARWIARRTGGK